jgi:broad specificity phosphatase PhoE
MGTLILIRHGQASALAAEYDKLTPLGEQQARHLGREWARCGTVFDQVYYGPRERQRRSAELALEACAEAGGPEMAAEPLPSLDEFRIEPLQKQFPEMAARRPELQKYLPGLSPEAPDEVRMVAMQKVGAALLRLWINDDIAAEGAESWSGFCARVEGALQSIVTKAAPRARIAAFTSAGLIGACARAALGLDPDRSLELVLRVRNASTSEFLFTRPAGSRFSLASFNETGHFAGQPRLVTLL